MTRKVFVNGTPCSDALNWAVRLELTQLTGKKPIVGKTAVQAAAVAIVQRAIAGDTQAWTAIADRLQGKPAQSLAISRDDAPRLALESYPVGLLRQVSDLLASAADRPETVLALEALEEDAD